VHELPSKPTAKRGQSAVAESTTSDSLLIDARELSRLMSVSLATLHRMKAAGKIGPHALGLSRGCVRWRRESVVRWLDDCELEGRLLDRKTWQSLCEKTNGRHSR
jgi:predicted DNA-binding transcriptional regulator AlpA